MFLSIPPSLLLRAAQVRVDSTPRNLARRWNVRAARGQGVRELGGGELAASVSGTDEHGDDVSRRRARREDDEPEQLPLPQAPKARQILTPEQAAKNYIARPASPGSRYSGTRPIPRTRALGRKRRPPPAR